jgi:hypothetical protein
MPTDTGIEPRTVATGALPSATRLELENKIDLENGHETGHKKV